MGHDGFIGFGGGLMWLFWIGIVLAVIWAIKATIASGNNSESCPSPEQPLEILKKRYARGEIDEEEYNQLRRELE